MPGLEKKCRTTLDGRVTNLFASENANAKDNDNFQQHLAYFRQKLIQKLGMIKFYAGKRETILTDLIS